jgi:hypothetical protein
MGKKDDKYWIATVREAGHYIPANIDVIVIYAAKKPKLRYDGMFWTGPFDSASAAHKEAEGMLITAKTELLEVLQQINNTQIHLTATVAVA